MPDITGLPLRGLGQLHNRTVENYAYAIGILAVEKVKRNAAAFKLRFLDKQLTLTLAKKGLPKWKIDAAKWENADFLLLSEKVELLDQNCIVLDALATGFEKRGEVLSREQTRRTAEIDLAR